MTYKKPPTLSHIFLYFLLVALQIERLYNLVSDQENRLKMGLCSSTAQFCISVIIHLPHVVMFKKLQVSSLNETAHQGKNLHPCYSERGKQIHTICKTSLYCRHVQLSTRNLNSPYLCIAIPFLSTDVFRERIQNDLTGKSSNPLTVIQSLQQVTCQAHCDSNFLPLNLFLQQVAAADMMEDLYLNGISDLISSDTSAKEIKSSLCWFVAVHSPSFFLIFHGKICIQKVNTDFLSNPYCVFCKDNFVLEELKISTFLGQ